MEEKRGLAGRLSFLHSPSAKHMARSEENWSYFRVEQSGEELSRPGIYPGSPAVPWQKADGGFNPLDTRP